MGILDIFKPNNQSSGGTSGGSSAASSAPKLVNTSSSSSGGKSGGSSGSVLSNFWSALKNTANNATGQNKQPTLLQPLPTTNKSSTPNSLVTIPSSSKNGSAQTKVGGGLVKIGDSLAQTKVGSGLIKVGNDLVEGYKSTVKDINDAFIPQAESKIQNPTKIVTTEMPVTGNERLDKVLSDYRAKATEAYSAEWREKYKGQDLDASLAALKQEIDKAPTTTDMDLVERSKKIAEYQFLEAVKNYGIAMDYDLQGGYDQIDQMDKQIAELKKLEKQYVDTHQGNDIQNWNVSDDDQYTKVKNMSDEEYQQVRADLAALEQYRKALYNEVNDVKQVQLGSIYAGIAADKDFEEYSKKGATMDGNERVKKADSKKSVYHFMTDEEAKMYDALFAASGKEAADTYVDVFLKDALNARKGGEIAENWMTPFGMKNDAGKVFGALTLLGPASMIGGIRGLGNQIKGLGPGKSGELETTALDYARGIAREKLGEIDTSIKLPNGESYELRVNGANLPQILADSVQSGGNMAPSILAGYLVSLIPGGQGTAAKIVASAVMGGSVYGNVKSEMMKAGYNEQSASTYAALNATSEVALENAIGGFEVFGGAMGIPGVQEHLGNISNAYLRYAATMGVKIHSEGKEEYLQDVIDPLFKNIAFHENNEFNPLSKEGAYSYLVAAISTFGLEGHSTRVNTAKCEAAGAYVNAVREANPELYDLLINEALEGENEDIRELAEGIKSGEYKATNGNLGQLLLQMAQDGKYKQPERLVRESAEHLAELKIENVRGFAQSKAQEEWDTLVMSHPGKTVLDPVVSELLQKTGWDVETAQKQGEILTKVFSGIIPTGREIVALDRNNTHVQEIFKKYTGMDLSTVKDKAEAARMLIDAARNAWETETYQEALRDANEKFMTGRTEMLMNSQYAPQVEQAKKDAMTGTDLQIGKRRLSKKKNAPIIPDAQTTGATTVSGFDRESFIKDYMAMHGVDQETAEKAWEKRAAMSAVLNGGNENGEQVRSDAPGRVDDVAGREGASEVHDGAAGSDGAANAGRGASTRESRGASEAEKVTGRVIPAEAYSEEQREFVQSCIKDGFKEVELIDGPLYNAAGQLLNAKVDSATGKLTISAADQTTMIKAARHERVHLWLSSLGNGRARAIFVEQALNRLLPQEMLNRLFAAYSRVYTKAYYDLLTSDPDAFVESVYEEILCDMFGGMDNYGVHAGSYQNAAVKLINDSGIRERFLKNGPRMDESQNRAEQAQAQQNDLSRYTTEQLREMYNQAVRDGKEYAVENVRAEIERRAGLNQQTQAQTTAENVEETAETATENVEPAIDIDKAVAETMGVDEDESSLEELLTEAEEEEGSYHQKDGYWQDDEYYSVAEDTPRQGPSFLSPFKADINQTIPPDTRPFPGEPPMHEGMDRMSVASMAQGAGFELKLNSAGYPYQVIDKTTGKPVTEVTAKMMVDTPMGQLVQMAMTDGSLKDLSDTEKIQAAEKQYQMLADAMNLIVKYDDAALVWELVGSQMFSAIKNNSDTQYNRTIDFSTICKKTQAIVDAMSQTMIELGRGLTRREVEEVYLATGKHGESTPCPVCYVFSRWMGIGNLLDQINRFQNKYTNMDEAEIVTFMEGIEERARQFAEEKVKNSKNPDKKRDDYYYAKDGKGHKAGDLKLGKVLSDMKPGTQEADAIKVLSAHQQAVAMIAEIEGMMKDASPAQKADYEKRIKSLRTLVLSPDDIKATRAKLTTAEAKVEEIEEYQWLASTLMMKGQKQENGRPVFDENGEAVNTWVKNPKFKSVPPEILFDLNRGGDFAHDYPLTWAFRTGKGCAAGKAITPYADARVGETIQGVAGDIKDIRVGEDLNEFLNGDTKKQKATLAKAIKAMKQQNLIGGMRYQSTSDFRYEYGSDYLMTMFEMQAMGANVQLYTKVIEAVDFLASTGADCNLSVMPLNDGYTVDPVTGKKKLAFSDVTGINHQAAIAKAKQYDNVQCILVGINDENILLALESEDVTFVIPFHGSGQNVHQIQTLMNLLGESLNVMKAKDYSDLQSDHVSPNQTKEQKAMWNLRKDIIMGKLQNGPTAAQQMLLDQNPHLQKLYNMFYVDETEPAYHNFLATKQAEQIFPYEYWDKTTTYETADRNGEIFKSYCESMGIIPRFSGKDSAGKDRGFGNFAYGGENGQSVKGYWKLLIDRKMYKNTYDENGNWTGYGEYRDQQKINMTDVKLENLDKKWGEEHFTEKEMSKPIDTSQTKDIVTDSIKAIEILRATGDIYDRTAVTPEARKILTEADPNWKPSSEDLMHEQMEKLKEKKAKNTERASVADEIEETTDVSGPIQSWTDEDIAGITKGLNFKDPTGELLNRVFNGSKQYETRSYSDKTGNGKLPQAYLNKPMGIVQTGAGRAQLVGFWELGDGFLADSQWLNDHKAKLGNDGTEFEAHEGDQKWVYPIKYAGRTNPMEVTSPGQRERNISSITQQGRSILQTDARTDNGDERFSIATDQEYEDALSNDPEAAQQMVDQAAEAAGYTRRAFHGTTHQFWTFARGKEGIHFGDLQQAEDTLKKDKQRSQYITAPITQVLDDLESYDEEDRRAISQEIEMLWKKPGFDPMRNFPQTPNTYNETSPKDIRKYAKRVLSLYTKDPRLLNIKAPNPDAKNERIIDAYIKMEHPMTIPVDLGFWNVSRIGLALLDKLDGSSEDYMDRDWDVSTWYPAEDIKGIEITEADRPILQRFEAGDGTFDELVDFLHEHGVDSIEYTNMIEGTEDAPSYLLLDPEQVKLADVATYDDNGALIPLSERFNSETGDMRYSLASVEPVKPTSDKWSPSHTTEEAMEAYPNLWNVAAEESEESNPTQRASTASTYRNIYNILKDQGFEGTILDASSGMGLGTKVGREEPFNFDVEDIEPYPGPNYKPMYTDYSKLNKQYDVIISSAVLNVLPQDQRDALVVKMGELLKDGGKMYITTRGTKNDVDNLAKSGKNIQLGPSEWIETVRGSYQKGFTNPELKAYLEDALGPGFTVELSNKSNGGKFNNNTSIVVTKSGGTTTSTETSQERYSIQTLDDGTQYVKLDGNIFQKEDGSTMTPTEAYNQLVDGTPITTADGDTITFVKKLPGKKDMRGEVLRRYAASDDDINHVAMSNTVNKNLVELLQASKATDRNQPERHPSPGHRGISSFDERTVYMADDNNAYKLTMAIANTKDGRKVMYAKKYVAAEPDLLEKIKKADSQWKTSVSQPSVAETGGKHPVNQPTDTVSQTKADVNTERASVADDNEESKETRSHFPKGSLEDTLYELMASESIEDAEKWLNQMREKNEEGKAAKSAKPVIPRANKAVPIGEEQRKAQWQVMQEKIDEYGEIPSGEKAARETHTPNKTGPDDYVRRFVRTAKEAKATPERMVDQIDADLLGNDALTYARITDTKAVAAADREYDTRGYQALKNEWNGIARVDKMPSKYDIALGERLYIEAARQGDDAFALRTLADVAAMGTAAGQIVQAMRLLKKMGPVGQLYYFQKAVDRMNAQNKGRIAKGSMQPIHLNQELAQQVLLAESQKEIEDAMKALIKDTANQLPVTLKDKWDAWRYLAMLGNPRTHIRNVFGNAVFWPIRFVKDLLAAAGENIFLKDEQRTKSAAFLLNSGKYKDIRAFAASNFESMKKEITGSGKLNPVNEILQARDIFKGLGILDKLSEKNSEWLEKEDVIFLRNAYINAMSQYLVARGLTAADLAEDSRELNQARQYAALEAQKATYRDFSMVASALNRLKDIPVAGQLIDGLMPFTKTPMNILKRGIEYSPIGLMKSISYDLMKVKQGDMTAAEAIDHFAAGMTGTMIAALGWLLAACGIARGSDDDDKKKADLEKTQGHQAYSLEFDGMSFTIDWMAPVALPFFVGVEAYNQVSEGGTPNFYDFADAMTLILEPMMSLSMLDGVNNVLSAAAYAENNAVQSVATTMLTSYISQGLPTIGAQLARTLDTDRRSTYVDKNNPAPGWLQRFVQQNEGKIPGVAQNKMAYVDTWGRKDNSGGLAMRALENFILPWYQNRIRENPVEHELMRLAKTTGDSEVLPSYISKSFTVDGETVDLTADQYEKLKMVTGKESLKLLGEIMSSPAYDALDDAEKVKMIKNAMTITSTLGRQAIREDYKPAAWVQRAIDNDNYEDAVTFHFMQSMDSGLSNYQLIECMYWLTPEDQGKLITAQYTPQAKMTDYKQKKHKFILDDDMKARSREIYEEMFWQEYPQLTASQKWADADIAGRAEMVKKLQTDVGKAARSAYGDELRAQGIASVYLDSPEEEAEEIAAVLNEFGYEP